MIEFGHDICGNLDAALKREWLETNGLGGFASSTIIGLNARRYPGPLIAPTTPPVGRLVRLRVLDACSLRYARSSRSGIFTARHTRMTRSIRTSSRKRTWRRWLLTT